MVDSTKKFNETVEQLLDTQPGETKDLIPAQEWHIECPDSTEDLHYYLKPGIRSVHVDVSGILDVETRTPPDVYIHLAPVSQSRYQSVYIYASDALGGVTNRVYGMPGIYVVSDDEVITGGDIDWMGFGCWYPWLILPGWFTQDIPTGTFHDIFEARNTGFGWLITGIAWLAFNFIGGGGLDGKDSSGMPSLREILAIKEAAKLPKEKE